MIIKANMKLTFNKRHMTQQLYYNTFNGEKSQCETEGYRIASLADADGVQRSIT